MSDNNNSKFGSPMLLAGDDRAAQQRDVDHAVHEIQHAIILATSAPKVQEAVDALGLTPTGNPACLVPAEGNTLLEHRFPDLHAALMVAEDAVAEVRVRAVEAAAQAAKTEDSTVGLAEMVLISVIAQESLAGIWENVLPSVSQLEREIAAKLSTLDSADLPPGTDKGAMQAVLDEQAAMGREVLDGPARKANRRRE